MLPNAQGSELSSLRGHVRRMAQLSASAWDRDKDLEGAVEEFKVRKQSWAMFWGLAYRSIGVVYGDLGTSPLYTYPTVFAKQPSRLAIYGSCSLILWILMLQLVIKYICVTLYADDNGEGGTFALYSLLCRHIGITPFGKEEASDATLSEYSPPRELPGSRQQLGYRLAKYIKASPRLQAALLMLVFLGTSMLLGDGVLTCAIEVTSAVSGLQMKVGISQGVIVGVTCAILVVLFSIQFLGTSKIGVIFSPILLLWFASNAALGIYNIAKFETSILAAFNPAYGFRYLVQEGKAAWVSLGGIILCVTGAESMFNDMGHFSRTAIQDNKQGDKVHHQEHHRGSGTGTTSVSLHPLTFLPFTTLVIVMPSCMLSYLGEAAYLVKHPEAFRNPYFAAVPQSLFWPVFAIATAGSVVAAQSLITANFSIVKQSVALHCFPPVKIVQTSSSVAGQVYLPFVNWALMVGSIAVVAAFQTTERIGNAFGVAFIFVMMVSTILVTLVQLVVWKIHPLLPLLFCSVFLLIEGVPASALLYKVPHGAWFPLALAAVIITISYLWHYGCSQRVAYALAHTTHLSSLLQHDQHSDKGNLVLLGNARAVHRVPGLALYYSDGLRGLPEAFVHLVMKLPAVHETVIFITVRKVPLPTASADERFLIKPLQLPGFFRVVARYGYQDFVDQGPSFVADLTTRIAALVRYNSLLGGPAPMADSAAEIPLATPSAAFASAPTERRLVGGSPATGTSEAGTTEGKAERNAQTGSVAAQPAEPSTAASSSTAGRTPSSSPTLQPGQPSQCSWQEETDMANKVLRSADDGVTYVLSKSTLIASTGSSLMRKFVLESLYPILLRNSRAPTASWKIPTADVIEVGVIFEA